MLPSYRSTFPGSRQCCAVFLNIDRESDFFSHCGALSIPSCVSYLSLGCSVSHPTSILPAFPLVSRGDLSHFLVRANPSTCTFASFPFLFLSKTLTFQCSPFSCVSSWPPPLALDMNCYLPSWLIRTILEIPLLYCPGATLNFFLILSLKYIPVDFFSCALFPIKWFRTLFFFFLMTWQY